jgi:hypothetical protein
MLPATGSTITAAMDGGIAVELAPELGRELT